MTPRVTTKTPADPALDVLERFSALLVQLNQDASTLSADRFQAEVFTKVNALIPIDAGWWALGGFGSEPELFEIYLHNLTDQTLAEYNKTRQYDTVIQEAVRNPGVTLNVVVRDWYPEEYWPYLDVFGYRHALCTNTTDPITGLFTAITLYRADPDRPFNEQDRRLKQMLMPHWIDALNRAKIEPSIRGVANTLLYPLAAIVDAAGMLRYAAEGFGEMLQREWPDWRGLMLPEPLLAKVALRADGEFFGARIAAKITFHQNLPLVQLRPRLLSDHLSEQQLKVARYTCEGLSFKEIARLMDLSPGTVRNYLHNIYRKLGVNNKIQLIEALREAE
jgi:DNA-binding CsgD family transcriptional regulator